MRVLQYYWRVQFITNPFKNVYNDTRTIVYVSDMWPMGPWLFTNIT